MNESNHCKLNRLKSLQTQQQKVNASQNFQKAFTRIKSLHITPQRFLYSISFIYIIFSIVMVLIATPLQDIVCPVVYIEHSANLPDFLGEATAQIGEHYARTLLPEFTLYKYAGITSNLVNEVKALASSENSAKYPITFAGDLVQTLAELPDPGKTLTRRLKNAIKSRKPCEPKKQDPVFKSLLPSKGLSTLELGEKSGTAFILSEPAIASTEGRFNGDKQVRLVFFPFIDTLKKGTLPFEGFQLLLLTR